ncbi:MULTISPECIES: phage tail protein [Pseudomonas]|uniref:Phage protein, P2 GpU family n=1 Tax=Pseudomonas chlororaphis O6 TaxID=1037915 RepID=A0AB33WTB0_9PSED|nr:MULTISPECIES: phage tail protein [Pseudomonas]AZD14169.1 Unclassified tail protein [Pseudomonas chlororaphis]AZD20556.1 Unclassified tail protein [Pseudomonas chlororaphis subsp. aurantiaca]AZD27965.1 Unclassified tail protein [Pseudomonas chlororaphis]AZD34014.1 Unclassified tail protein [Pseudomonas chlororaphis subsp. aurantiaca]AZD40348.1 Unclassified tail protein [Pseudomonas chlororaphis subsp. aurantiaca]
MRQQMVLGSFIFGQSRGFAYSSLVRKSGGGWVSLEILTSKPKSSQTGQGLQGLTISGKSMRAIAMTRLDELRALQALRVPLPLVDGIGRNWGLWRIDSVSESQSYVIDDGTAMVNDWVIELTEFINA